MNDIPLVSIALCTYNGGRFLNEQLESILQQTHQNIEVIIVDDKSSDNTVEIIKSFQPNSKIQFYQNDQNIGYAKNFAKAISLCTGEFISLADQDDIWLPKKIETMLTVMSGNSGVYHDSSFIRNDGKLTGTKLSDKVRFVSGKIPESLLLYNYIAGHTLMFRQEVLKYALPIPSGIYHDWWLAFVCKNLKGLDYIEKPFVHYRIHDSNQTVLEEQNRKIRESDSNPVRRYKKLRKLVGTLQVLRVFRDAPFIDSKLRQTIERLIDLEKGRAGRFFSFDLFFFLTSHMAIYQSGHRGLLGKLNAMRKDSFGIYKCR